MELFVDLKDYREGGGVFKRTAARGIIKRGNKYLLIHSKYGDCKFPGGGAEEGETPEQTLVREVKEETGYRVIPSSIKYFGMVHEKRKGTDEDILEMDSFYYTCAVEDIAGERRLDEYEEEYEYNPGWLTLREAIDFNSAITEDDAVPWVTRDVKVMEYLSKTRL